MFYNSSLSLSIGHKIPQVSFQILGPCVKCTHYLKSSITHELERIKNAIQSDKKSSNHKDKQSATKGWEFSI